MTNDALNAADKRTRKEAEAYSSTGDHRLVTSVFQYVDNEFCR